MREMDNTQHVTCGKQDRPCVCIMLAHLQYSLTVLFAYLQVFAALIFSFFS